MRIDSISNVAFLGNYLPRKCGIATFTTDLSEAVSSVSPQLGVSVIAMTNTPETYNYPKRVSFEIRQHNIDDYKRAADYINSSNVDILCLQHEFGIFGGAWGNYLLTFMKSINVPIVTTFHTVLEKDIGQEEVFREICDLSDRVVVMSNMAMKILDKYKIPDEKKIFIHHGVPDLPFVDPNFYKDKFKAMGKKVIFSFGLIGPDKGLEYMLEAMPKIIKKHNDVIYIILGSTHPEIVKSKGEEYYLFLQRLVDKLELNKHVFFHKKFVELEELCEYLSAADIYVTPYIKKEQIVSGTLAYAVGTGKAVVSTPYWYAQELLADNRGMLAKFKNPSSLAQAINKLLDDPTVLHTTRIKAYQYGRDMTWKNVAINYVDAFNDTISSIEEGKVVYGRVERPIRLTSLPEVNLNHLRNLTSHYGIVQHAKYTVPNYKHGYALDDNARALILSAQYFKLYQNREILFLLDKYLAFLINAQDESGRFTNFFDMGLSPTEENDPAINLGDDWHGRSLWALGYLIAFAPDHYSVIAKECFDKAVTHRVESLRGAAFAILGIFNYLRRYGGARDVRSILISYCDMIVTEYERHQDSKWQWFENILAYANGLLPTALFKGYTIEKNIKYFNTAMATMNFLLDNCIRNDTMSLIGSHRWYKKNKVRSLFDQQPIDAFWMIKVCKAAYLVTKDEEYLKPMKISFEWFLGGNDNNRNLYDFVTGGCYDGLTRTGVNLNQGAESTICFLLSLLSMKEISVVQENPEKEA
ncbi:glycosyl transferase group 1 [Candidatus Scalindua japonica]|uniref:Glycosyl transferase group 1 n=1 Tax=Candidatus Scalindua japonica TaxID=1284222 RepID=A0A286U1W6_9BACT|nr:glycosyltransferase family 4 protein [Candidatus Scalindua japonica]GAX62138.1 glycosyl transferase group 1 [Candidatus Scalindua japonica]